MFGLELTCFESSLTRIRQNWFTKDLYFWTTQIVLISPGLGIKSGYWCTISFINAQKWRKNYSMITDISLWYLTFDPEVSCFGLGLTQALFQLNRLTHFVQNPRVLAGWTMISCALFERQIDLNFEYNGLGLPAEETVVDEFSWICLIFRLVGL